jgi:4-diphosphocytidyl-2-C-methyl-D-erythritol kinase
MTRTARVEAVAKVNLRLRVLAREASGYHALETIFCAVSLADALELRLGGEGIRLHPGGEIDTGPPEQNLVVRAAERFYGALGEPAAVSITLHKRIPSAAGLGGGSSDGAATLRALNALHGSPFSPRELMQIGIALGSDVPFFLCGSPLALAWGRGERLLAVPPLPPRPVLIVHPGVAMPTSEAFRRIAEERGDSGAPEAFAAGVDLLSGWDGVASLAENDFEALAMKTAPGLAGAKAAMLASGAILALLAGSGGSLFGVFRDPAARESAVALVEEMGMGMTFWRAETLGLMPGVEVDPAEGSA